MKMKYFSLALLILDYLTLINCENSIEETRENVPIIISSPETNETTRVIEESVLSSETLSELQDLAKNISHSKGIYRETEKKSLDEKELRRSFLKKVTVAAESDNMKDVLERIHSDGDKLKLLQELEFLVHQYDVAVNFAALGGLEILSPLLFSTDDEIASCVASVLGAAMQSNPTVQQLAVKHKIGKNLLSLLSHPSHEVLSRILFALGSLLRNSPEAQEDFFSTSATSQLADLLRKPQVPTKTKLKIINLFHDLAIEQEIVEFNPNSKSSDKMERRKRLFINEIQSCHICEMIPSFLDFEDFDTHQKIVAAMTSLYSICSKDFKNVTINNRLLKLLKMYDPENPLYSTIDKDFRQVLYIEIKALYQKNSKLKIEL